VNGANALEFMFNQNCFDVLIQNSAEIGYDLRTGGIDCEVQDVHIRLKLHLNDLLKTKGGFLKLGYIVLYNRYQKLLFFSQRLLNCYIHFKALIRSLSCKTKTVRYKASLIFYKLSKFLSALLHKRELLVVFPIFMFWRVEFKDLPVFAVN